jgi:ATP-dependent protease ClpP protease subunit
MQVANNEATIEIGGVIGDSWDGVTAQSFIDELTGLGKVDTINLSIYSGGGSVIEGNAIFMALATHAAKVNANITFAASMATQIAMAADTISMAENGWFMIHNPSSVVVGESSEMRKTADLLDGMKAQAISTYQRHAKLSDVELGGMMDEETWLNAEDALSFGFIHSITEAVPAAAAVDVEANNAPDEAKAFMLAKEPPAPAPEMVDKAKAAEDAKAAYDEGHTAGIAEANKLAETISAEAVAKAEAAEAEAKTARVEAQAAADELKKAEAKIESITAGFEYNTDASKNAPKAISKA